MTVFRPITGLALLAAILLVSGMPAMADSRPKQPPPQGYRHTRFAAEQDILRKFRGFVVSFDSKDDDDDELGADLLRVPHWVSQEVRRWEPTSGDAADDAAWCIETLDRRPSWFTDSDMYASGVAPDDSSYRNSGFDRGHMASKLLVERLGQDAAYNTHTLLNAIPQRPRFNQGIWQYLEYLTGAWAQKYGAIWVMQGPVFYEGKAHAWIGDENERKVAVPDAAFKIVIRDKTDDEKSGSTPGDREAPEVLAFIYPQLGPGYFGPRGAYRHERFLTTVDEIEKLTGLDFNTSDDPAVETRVERLRAAVLWEPRTVDLKQRRDFLSGCRD